MIYRTIDKEIRPETIEFVKAYNQLDSNPKLAVKKLNELGWKVECFVSHEGEWKREAI